MNDRINNFFSHLNHLFIHQVKEWAEILVDFETRNKYQVLDEAGNNIGFIAEQNKGFFAALVRIFLRSHRPMHIVIYDENRKPLIDINRPFYWFFSDMTIHFEGKVLGHVYKRFGIINKIYDLTDQNQNKFLRIKSPIWRIWTFNFQDMSSTKKGVIEKNWGGFLKEVFTDADKFHVEFRNFTADEKAIITAAAISIDLDYFEDNSSNRGIFNSD